MDKVTSKSKGSQGAGDVDCGPRVRGCSAPKCSGTWGAASTEATSTEALVMASSSPSQQGWLPLTCVGLGAPPQLRPTSTAASGMATGSPSQQGILKGGAGLEHLCGA